LECAEIRDSFVAGRLPTGPAVQAHLEVCPHCHELFEHDARLGRSLAQAVGPEVTPGDLLALVERDVSREVGLRARLRALPSRLRAGTLVGVAGALLGFQLLLRRRPDFAEYSPTVFWGVALALTVAFVLGATRVVRGASAPLRSSGRERVLALALLLAPALVALLAPLGTSSPDGTSWANPSGCFSYGTALVVPLVLLYWLFERRDSVPVSALVSAGALAGLAANLLLHAHCSSANLAHLLLGHASIGLVWALALRLVSGSPQPSR
jgi:hypothetical protein